MSVRSPLRLCACILLLGALGGCSGSLQNTGNSILETLGLQSGPRSFDSTESMVDSSVQITSEEEYFIGRAIAARLLSIYPPSSDQALQLYVRQVGASTASFSSRPATFGGYHFMVVESPEINAFSAPGGYVFLTTGFLRRLPNEEALAAVLAHEIAHVTERHGLQGLPKDKMESALDTLGSIAGSVNCSEALAQAVVLFDEIVDEVVDRLLKQGYSREQEFAADAGAFDTLGRNGYDPRGLKTALEELERAVGTGKGGWFATHPTVPEREQELAAKFAALPPYGNSAAIAKRSARFKAAL